MDLVQSGIVTDDVARLAAFYARMVRVSVVPNDYYVEVPTGADQPAGSRLGDAARHAAVGVPNDDLQGPGGNLVNVSSPARAAPG